eukprot:CAMPEP_0114247572 /NCGR_PEP_ID=MMETSP0058-20121206/13095_1 /TAXON_ID=36894 /ORGANISM="Pyramimonas parkeae, CCMP726" /LENGTH=186 /DNA_ID=CAMNT_0001360889 /DNA_START=1341 /DNA_END=1898 /DNA_ORIENTATION=+
MAGAPNNRTVCSALPENSKTSCWCADDTYKDVDLVMCDLLMAVASENEAPNCLYGSQVNDKLDIVPVVPENLVPDDAIPSVSVPLAILVRVFGTSLDLCSVLHAAEVCKLWAQAIRHPALWKVMFLRHFPVRFGGCPEEVEESIDLILRGVDSEDVDARPRDWKRSYKTRWRIARRQGTATHGFDW